jgi:DNA-directed RNA polymerase specialized sigma24 family protein
MDAELLVRLRAGDEQAFVILVRRHHAAMLRLASGYVPSLAVAEEVVQDTWLGVLRGPASPTWAGSRAWAASTAAGWTPCSCSVT